MKRIKFKLPPEDYKEVEILMDDGSKTLWHCAYIADGIWYSSFSGYPLRSDETVLDWR